MNADPGLFSTFVSGVAWIQCRAQTEGLPAGKAEQPSERKQMDLYTVIAEARRQLEGIDQAIRSLEALEHLDSKAKSRASAEGKTTVPDIKPRKNVQKKPVGKPTDLRNDTERSDPARTGDSGVTGEEPEQQAAGARKVFSRRTVSAHRTSEVVAPGWESLPAREEEPRPVKRGRVLLIEDDPDIRVYLQCLLIPQYDVTATANGRDALDLALAYPPDLVLCGVMVPLLDGPDLIEALRADSATSSLPIILLSARAGEEARLQGLATRADDYVGKPFTPNELLARVAVHLSLSQIRKQEAQRTRETIEAELNDMTRLYEVSNRLRAAPEPRAALEEFLVATCIMMNSQMGYVQVYDPRTQTLAIAAQRGIMPDLLDQLSMVGRDSSSADEAANGGDRIIIEDVNEDESFRPLRAIAASVGFRSLQSTPLLSRTGALLGVLSTYWGHPHRPSDHDLHMLDLYAHEAAEILDHIQTAQELQYSFHQLRAVAARLQNVREEERKKVAREIHDELGQSLTAIKMELNSLFFEWPGEQKPTSRTESITRLVDQTIQSVRKIATELRPGILDALGLVAAIEWAAAEFETRTGTRCLLDLPNDALKIDQERDTAIFRILQETLTNIARHSHATEAKIWLTKDADGSLSLDVHDNGIGFNEEELAARGALGILGMRERTLLLGGEFLMSGARNQGTRIRVRIPLSRSGEEAV